MSSPSGWVWDEVQGGYVLEEQVLRLSTDEAARVLLEIGCAGRAQRIVAKLKAAGYEVVKVQGKRI